MEGGERCAFSSWKYSHYFEFVSAKDGNIKVRCTLCAGGDKVLSSYKNTTSNLKKHLESQHCSQTYRASPSRWCEAERRRSPTTQTTKAGHRCKTSKWGRVEEVGRAVGLCCSGNAALKHGWLALFRAIINQILLLATPSCLTVNRLSFLCWGCGGVVGSCWM